MNTLSSLFGQEAAIRALRKALESGCLPGTYLFVGAAGVGKGALAQAFAAAAACLTPQTSPFDACGVCASCRALLAGRQADIVTIAPAGEQTQIGQFWDREGKSAPGVLSRTLAYAPTQGHKRVYIIERADTLTESAANSLLKVLEETPPYALFLLLAPHASRVLPTIVSRSQTIRLNPAPVEALTDYLRTHLDVESDRAAMLAAYAEGRIGQAVQMAQNPNVGDEINKVLDYAESLPDAPRVRALKLAEQLRKLSGQMKALVGEEAVAETSGGDEAESGTTTKEKTGRRQLAVLFDLLVAFYRDLLVLRVGETGAGRIVNRDRAARLTRLAQSGSPERWMRCLDALLMARRRLDANANIALLTESLLMTLLTI